MSESTHDGANCLDFGVPTEWQGLTPRNFDGPVTAPTQRGTIVPAYLTEASDHWVERVRRVLENSLERKSVNRVVNSIRKPQNGLFDELVSTVYDPVRGTYLCFAKNVYLDRKHQGEVINALAGGWAKFQQKLPLFTNAFSACELVDGAYSGPAPKHRIINCGQVVMTVEWDLREPYFLDQQIRWSIAGSDRKCHLDRLYASLSRFRDFRLLEAVWSGHKSVHLHILVDSRHLNPGRFSGEFPRSPGLVDDIPNALFRDGVQKSSELLAPEIMRELGLDLPPDETLHQPDRFRRTPWGIRSLDVDNIFGAPAVTQVPQVVLWSKGRAYARAGDDWLLQPERFLEVARQRRRPFSGSRAAPTLEPELARGFVSELAKLCERIFGPKESAPFPVSVDKGSNGWRIRFLNNLNDHSAGSVMEGHHYTILMGSQDPVIRSKRYSFPLSADELVERYMHTGTLGTSFPMSQHHWSEIQFRQALEWYNSDKPEAVDSPDNPASPWGLNRSKPDAGGRIPTVPDFILQDNVQEAANAERSVTVSMPGAGKTHALIRRMLDEDFDPDRRGYRVIACSSYQQAVSKMEEFRREFGNTRQAVLVRAFNDVYKEQSADGRLGMDAAARLGCHSVIEAVYATAPDTAAVLDRYKRDVARQLGFDEDGDLDYGIRDNVIVFCVHSLIHKWSWAGGTKNWLHPLFDSWREAKLSGEWADVAAIQDVIDHDMRLLWVLYDEISMSDLIVHHRKQDVDSVHQFIDSMDRFDDLKPDELLEAWISHTPPIREEFPST